MIRADAAHEVRGQETTTSPRTGVPPHHTLKEHHARYLEERGVDPRRALQGFWTARKPSEIPEVFSSYQRRRAPALIAEFHSPDRETVAYQMYSDYPGKDRKGKKIKWMSPPSERARMVLGAHPGLVEEVRTGVGPLWVVEGITRVAASASFSIAAVGYAGCFGWQRDGEPLECWRHINLKGRLLLVAPDADYRTNENVQKALAGLVAFLEGQGARVLVVDVPEIGGDPNTGLDDWIAANGHPAPLERAAQPFKPVEVGRERLKRDERLRLFVAAKRREVDGLPTRKTRECNAAKVARYMVETSAPAHGKPLERGVEVHPSFPQIAEAVRFGSFQTVRKAIDLLESVGFLERSTAPRGKREAASYVLFYPWGGGSGQSVNMREIGGAEKETQNHREKREAAPESSLYQRDSLPCLHSTRGGGDRSKSVPALRNSKLLHTFVYQNGRKVVVHSDYFRRYGSRREEIIRYIIETGGADEVALWEKFGSEKSRLRDFRRTWIKPMLDDGVFVQDGASVLPSPGWPEALERVRDRTLEEEDNRRQSEKYVERRRKYLQAKDTKVDPTPELPGEEKVRELFRDMEQRDEAARIEEQRSKAGVTVEVFIHDTLEQMGKVRMGLLRELWADKGGDPSHVWHAVRSLGCKLERLPEHDNSLFVFPPIKREADSENLTKPPPAPVVELRPEKHANLAPLKTTEGARENHPATVAGLRDPDPPPDDWRDHPLDCECEACAFPVPSYARPIGGRA